MCLFVGVRGARCSCLKERSHRVPVLHYRLTKAVVCTNLTGMVHINLYLVCVCVYACALACVPIYVESAFDHLWICLLPMITNDSVISGRQALWL